MAIKFVSGVVVAILSILVMAKIVGTVDHVPVLPRNAYEWREFAEYGASIAFGFFTGVVIRQIVIAMRYAAGGAKRAHCHDFKISPRSWEGKPPASTSRRYSRSYRWRLRPGRRSRRSSAASDCFFEDTDKSHEENDGDWSSLRTDNGVPASIGRARRSSDHPRRSKAAGRPGRGGARLNAGPRHRAGLAASGRWGGVADCHSRSSSNTQ